MNSLIRLSDELAQLRACLDGRDFRRYLWLLASTWRAVVSRRTLAPADSAMTGNVTVTTKGKRIIIPLDEMGRALSDFDQTPTFGSIREIYAGDVYLRAFRPGVKAQVIVDLGSNRGMFLMLGSKVLEAELAIGVEPQEFYDCAFDALRAANGDDGVRFVRIACFASAMSGSTKTTMQEIMDKYAISSIGFLKCDIEGGEFDVFLANNGFLRHVENIAMELHPTEGDVSPVVDALVAQGFDVLVTDQFGRPATIPEGHYLYASRTGALATVGWRGRRP